MTTNMNAVGIVTSDMQRSLQFYAALGLNTPEFHPNDPHYSLELPTGVNLMWDTVELVQQFMPNYVHGVGGSIGLAFECGSPKEVDEIYRKLIGAGFEGCNEPWDAFWGQRYAILKDPDGNATSLYAWFAGHKGS